MGFQPLNLARILYRRMRPATLDSSHRWEAQAALRVIETERGKLKASLASQADAYAREVLGSPNYAPWLHVYACFRGTFVEGWIPDNYYKRLVVDALKGEHGRMSRMRCMAGRIFPHDRMPDQAYLVDGRVYDLELNPIPRERLRAHIFANGDRVVFKADSTTRGTGLRMLNASSFDPSEPSNMPNGIFQRLVSQHESLSEVEPNAAATLRITTVVDPDGRPTLRSSYIKFAVGGATHIAGLDSLRVPVSLGDGAFAERGYLADWRSVDRHPDTGTIFAGRQMPSFEACRALALDLHRRYPFACCIGWDIAVDQDNAPTLLEWNAGHNDIKFSEATQGPCFADLGWETLWRRGPA